MSLIMSLAKPVKAEISLVGIDAGSTEYELTRLGCKPANSPAVVGGVRLLVFAVRIESKGFRDISAALCCPALGS